MLSATTYVQSRLILALRPRILLERRMHFTLVEPIEQVRLALRQRSRHSGCMTVAVTLLLPHGDLNGVLVHSSVFLLADAMFVVKQVRRHGPLAAVGRQKSVSIRFSFELS